MTLTAIAPQTVTALLGATIDNAFAVLGYHAEEDGARITCLAPGADRVWMINRAGTRLAELRQCHEEGLFSAAVDPGMDDYHYEVESGGASTLREDPYRFPSLLKDEDSWLFAEGRHHQAWRFLGAHPTTHLGIQGTQFALWAPNARRVAVVGNFNHWDSRTHVLRFHPASGIWEMFVPGPGPGDTYHYEILTRDNRRLQKMDPYAQQMVAPADLAAVITDAAFNWQDQAWLAARASSESTATAVSIYEVHLGSWQQRPDGSVPDYDEMTALLDYVMELGYTHIELMPITEYPFGGSWGYQPTGLFAPTRRYGSPDQLKQWIDAAHQRGIGILLDWVPAHFPGDAHGLGRFDGTALYEHEDPRRGHHPDWDTLIYNYGRREVVSYLVSSAIFWLEEYHIDGLRVDAVASMLYLDYSRKAGEWLPNEHGGRENLEAVAFLRQVNGAVHANYPGVLMIAEESTAWPGVTTPVAQGGLGFSYKWNMGWMNDVLGYLREDPVHRRHHHNAITFSLVYAFSEQFILALSHDEVVHGKGSLLRKMPGDRWQQFANLRTLLGFMWAHPGKKSLFMGAELGQWDEWNHDQQLPWELLDHDEHRGIQTLVTDLNHLYREHPALHQRDGRGDGFKWLDVHNAEQSVLAFRRDGEVREQAVYVVVNFTPVVRHDYELPVLTDGHYRELLNTDGPTYAGSGVGQTEPLVTFIANDGPVLRLTLPPLGVLFLGAVS